jgi:hypothetical protein
MVEAESVGAIELALAGDDRRRAGRSQDPCGRKETASSLADNPDANVRDMAHAAFAARRRHDRAEYAAAQATQSPARHRDPRR